MAIFLWLAESALAALPARGPLRGLPSGLLILTLAGVSGGSGCTWVHLTAEGEAVRLATPRQVSGCQRSGQVSAKVLDRIWFIPRKSSKVGQELSTLARNQAALETGDTIAPLGQIKRGSQTFGLYDCPEDLPPDSSF